MRRILIGEGSRGNPRTVATNWTIFKGQRRLNRDRGCWQLSNLYHPGVTDEQAFDPDFAARKAFEIWQAAGNGTVYGWKRWCSADAPGIRVLERAC